MSVKIILPAVLIQYTGNNDTIELEAGRSIAAVLNDACELHPNLRAKILDQSGLLQKYVNLYLNQANIASTGGLETIVKDGDEIIVVPAVAGG